MTDFTNDKQYEVKIPTGNEQLDGFLYVPLEAQGIVLFVHGSGSSRFSTRNQHVAHYLNEAGLATLLFDLLTPAEEAIDIHTREFRFDITLLASRLIDATNWCMNTTPSLTIGYFGSSTGGGAALVAAAQKTDVVNAVVSRGGRPDLAGEYLPRVKAPTLLIVGGNDDVVIELNQDAMDSMNCVKKLELVPGATHLFEEPGALDEVAGLTKNWFIKYLGGSNKP